MSVLEQVLREEYMRLDRKVEFYEQQLNSLPKGSIFIRKVGSSSYAYRKIKENGKVVSVYLGNVQEESVKHELTLSEEYHNTKKAISSLKFELSSLRKAIDSYDRKQRKLYPNNQDSQ